jgi:hypothetical protein
MLQSIVNGGYGFISWFREWRYPVPARQEFQMKIYFREENKARSFFANAFRVLEVATQVAYPKNFKRFNACSKIKKLSFNAEERHVLVQGELCLPSHRQSQKFLENIANTVQDFGPDILRHIRGEQAVVHVQYIDCTYDVSWEIEGVEEVSRQLILRVPSYKIPGVDE